MKRTLLACSAAVVALAMTNPVNAETVVHTQTNIQAQEIEGVNEIDFSTFDTNKDGKYSKAEVGEKLFYVFDSDGNHLIDNIEWNNRNMYTITPMEKETYEFVDLDADGDIDLSTMTYDTFYKESGLIRFDKNKNGLSASEFINVGLEKLDSDDNKMIDLEEWKNAYIASTRNAVDNPDNYN